MSTLCGVTFVQVVKTYLIRKFQRIEIGRRKAFSEEQSTLPFVQGND